MAIKSSAVSVGTNAVQLGATLDKDNIAGQSLSVQPATDIYIGGPDVTTVNGLLVPGGFTYSVNLYDTGDKLYGIAAAGNVDTRVLQVGV